MSITVKLPDELAALLYEEAARRSMTPDELATRVLAEHIPDRRHLGFVAIRESTSGRTGADAEEMLAERNSAADSAGRHRRPAGRRRS